MKEIYVYIILLFVKIKFLIMKFENSYRYILFYFIFERFIKSY